MFLNALRSFNSNFGVVALLAYVALFCLAFVLMFLFPLGSLVLVFLGIFGLAVVVPAAALAQALERALSRKRLALGQCPLCGAEVLVRGVTSARPGTTCVSCGSEWMSDGSTLVQ
ncbi:MAG: hypothetical protein O2819_05245 [Planctomycetota bacterium]|nr:hypothetical protein [Planctomycetota bacterium]